MSSKPENIYRSTIRTVCIIFGSLFNNITIREYNNDGTISDKRRKVEIAFGSKSHYTLWVEQMMRLPNGNTEIGIRLPKLTFEFTGLSYDANKQLNPYMYHTGNSYLTGTKISSKTTFSPAAYNFNMNLTLWAKDFDTSIQILDQILPYFKPNVAIKIKEQYELPIINDIYVVLDSINKTDNYLEGFEANRILEWSMDFTMSANIWQTKDIQESALIKEVLIDFDDPQTAALLKGFSYDT